MSYRLISMITLISKSHNLGMTFSKQSAQSSCKCNQRLVYFLFQEATFYSWRVNIIETLCFILV